MTPTPTTPTPRTDNLEIALSNQCVLTDQTKAALCHARTLECESFSLQVSKELVERDLRMAQEENQELRRIGWELADKVANALEYVTGAELVECMERHVSPALTAWQNLNK